MIYVPASIQRSKEAFRLSSDILMDLHGGMQVHRTFQKFFKISPPQDPIPIQVNRLCGFNAIIALDKWVEFYERYSSAIPDDVKGLAKRLKKEIESRGIPKFRDQVVGHIWSREDQRPLTAEEVDRRFALVAGPGIEEFMRWVCDHDGTSSEATAAGVVERVRDAICAKGGFSDADLHD